jgi:molecular chaperone GrpE
LKESLAEVQAKHDDILDKYRRSIAENDNMRKRLTKQIEDAKIFGIQVGRHFRQTDS